jgi:hypothetical protein
MVSHIICDHEHSPTGAYACAPQLLQKFKASFGIEATGLPSVDQLAVTQAHGAEISDTPSRRMMQQHRVDRLRRNPHPASRAVLLEVNFIHCPKVNALASCQSAKFFLPSLGPRHSRWQLRASASVGEIRVGEKAADIAGLPDLHPTSCLRMLTGFSHPIGFLPTRSPSAVCAMLYQLFGSAPRSIAAGDQVAPLQSDRSALRIRNGGSNTPRFAGRPPIALKLGDNSCLGRLATPRGAGGHNVIPRNVGFHPAIRALPSLHPLSLVASCRKDSTEPFRAQLLMSLCIRTRRCPRRPLKT